MTKITKRSLNYPLVISVAIHGIIVAFFSFLIIDSEGEPTKKLQIQIKQIIFEKNTPTPPNTTETKNSIVKKNNSAPQKKIKREKAIKPHEPTPKIKSLAAKRRTPSVKAKPNPQVQMASSNYAPTKRIPERINRVKISKANPISLTSLDPLTTQPTTKIATDFNHTTRPKEKVQPKLFSDVFTIENKEPAALQSSTETFIPRPLAKPMQVASIPKDFIDPLTEGADLNRPPAKEASGTKYEVKNSEGEDLLALKKGFSSQVWGRIAKAKFYPRIARKQGMEGKPIVEFELRSDGKLLNYYIFLSSSNKILDRAAIDAVKNASPYPGIPKSLNLESIKFKLPISFKLNEP